jgi:hypothetical protein
MFAPDYREAVSRSPSLKPRPDFGGIVAAGAALNLSVGGIALIVIAALR